MEASLKDCEFRLHQRAAQDAREKPPVFALLGRICHQILPELDQHMDKAVSRAVAIERVALQLAGIGRVIAHDDPRQFAAHAENAVGKPPVAVVENAVIPGALDALPHRREGMDGDKHGLDVVRARRRNHRRNRLMIGGMAARDAPGDFGRIHRAIARNDRTIRQAHDQCRVIRAAVKIDQQARPARNDRGRVKGSSHRARNARSTDVPGDVTLEFVGGKAQRAIFGRQGVRRMVADKDQALVAIGPDDLCRAVHDFLPAIFIAQDSRHDGQTMTGSRTSTLSAPRQFLTTLFNAAIAPEAHGGFGLPTDLAPVAGRTLVIAAGKAAGAHAAALAPALTGEWQGFLVAPRGYTLALAGFEVIAAGHPVPDAASVAAAARALELAGALSEGDRLLLLLSGGGSALLCAPAPGVTLDAKRALTQAILRSGATIGEMNAVRKHLSRIKGGRLAAAAWPAETITLSVSDVPGDDPAVIASGPTVADPTTLDDAKAILARYGISPSPDIAQALSNLKNETIKPGDKRLSRSTYRIIARPSDALAASARVAKDAGYEVINLGDRIAGEARVVAADHARLALAQNPKRPLVILSGGELTVTLGGSSPIAATGGATGGPSREYMLALAIALEGAPDIHALAADTDGIDGTDDAAGAFTGPETLSRALALHLDPAAFLQRHDAGGFFRALGDAFVTGPTRTNLNDFRAILVHPE